MALAERLIPTVVAQEEPSPNPPLGPRNGTSLEPACLTPAQVARLLQVSEKTLHRWAKQDASMPMLRIGRSVRFPRERLLTWLRRREQGRAQQRGRTASSITAR